MKTLKLTSKLSKMNRQNRQMPFTKTFMCKCLLQRHLRETIRSVILSTAHQKNQDSQGGCCLVNIMDVGKHN